MANLEKIRFGEQSPAIGGRNFIISQRRTGLLDDNDTYLITGSSKDQKWELRPRPALDGPVWNTSGTNSASVDYQILGAYYWPATGHFYWVTRPATDTLSTSGAATLRRSTSVTGAMSSLQVMGSTTEVYAHFEEYRYGTAHYLLVSIGTQMWYIDTSNVVTQITDGDFPVHEPKFAVLDGYVFVAKKNTQDIYNSAAGDVTSWQASTFIRAEADSSNVIGLAVLSNHLVAVKPTTCEIFKDAGIPSPNSPLLRVPEYYKTVGASSSIAFCVDGDRLYVWGNSKGSFQNTGIGTSIGNLWQMSLSETSPVNTTEIIDPGNLGQVFLQTYTLPAQRKVIALKFYGTASWIYAVPLWVIDPATGLTVQWTHQVASTEDQPDDSEYWLFGTFVNGYLFPVIGMDGSGYRKGVTLQPSTTLTETLLNSGTYRRTGITMRLEVPVYSSSPSTFTTLRSVKLLSPSIPVSGNGGSVTNGTISASVELLYPGGNGDMKTAVSRTWNIVSYDTGTSVNTTHLTLFQFGRMNQGLLRFIIPTATHTNGSVEYPAWDFSLYGIDLDLVPSKHQ
jgi:hypothetical protein